MIIEITDKTKNTIYAKIVYNMSYNKKTGKFTCECDGFVTKNKCYHKNDFIKYLKKKELIK